jgi:hypothetical protein
LNTTLLIRRDVFVPLGTTTVAISVLVDNDVQVFLNGTDVSGGLRSHSGCARTNPLSPFVATKFTGLVAGAMNKLAVLAVDRGEDSYLDVRVEDR